MSEGTATEVDDRMHMIVYVIRWVCRPCSRERSTLIEAVWKFYGPKYQRFLGHAMRSQKAIPCFLCEGKMWRTSWEIEEEEEAA